MKILIRDDGTWCRVYPGEDQSGGEVVDVPDDQDMNSDDIDTFVINYLDQKED